jgi:starvation-inducible DNA-binding protein
MQVKTPQSQLFSCRTVVRTARKIFPTAEKGNDQATIDLLTQRMNTHEKTAWMLRALLE